MRCLFFLSFYRSENTQTLLLFSVQCYSFTFKQKVLILKEQDVKNLFALIKSTLSSMLSVKSFPVYQIHIANFLQ